MRALRLRYRYILLALPAAIVMSAGGISESAAPPAVDRQKCTPWVLPASRTTISVELLNGNWHFDGSALLVGCREILSTMTPLEQRKALAGVEDFVRAQGLNVIKRGEESFRSSATTAINIAVGRTVASDAWLSFNFSESL